MSYEGHVQYICKNGHYYQWDAYAEDTRCPHCGEREAWYNGVDDTNGDSSGVIPYALLRERFLLSPEKVETCNLGHKHIVEQERLRIPGREEADVLRHRRDYKTGELVLLSQEVMVTGQTRTSRP